MCELLVDLVIRYHMAQNLDGGKFTSQGWKNFDE